MAKRELAPAVLKGRGRRALVERRSILPRRRKLIEPILKRLRVERGRIKGLKGKVGKQMDTVSLWLKGPNQNQATDMINWLNMGHWALLEEIRKQKENLIRPIIRIKMIRPNMKITSVPPIIQPEFDELRKMEAMVHVAALNLKRTLMRFSLQKKPLKVKGLQFFPSQGRWVITRLEWEGVKDKMTSIGPDEIIESVWKLNGTIREPVVVLSRLPAKVVDTILEDRFVGKLDIEHRGIRFWKMKGKREWLVPQMTRAQFLRQFGGYRSSDVSEIDILLGRDVPESNIKAVLIAKLPKEVRA